VSEAILDWPKLMQEALTARIPTVIDVRTSLAQSFSDITSPLAVAASPRRR